LRGYDRKKIVKQTGEEAKGTIAQIRDSFLRMFVSIFKCYPECINEKSRGSPTNVDYFDQKKFIELCNKDYKPFVQQFMETLIFHTFLDKKERPERKEDMLRTRYFDENITAKFNRKILSIPKVTLPLNLDNTFYK
jgi:hypothetical protein